MKERPSSCSSVASAIPVASNTSALNVWASGAGPFGLDLIEDGGDPLVRGVRRRGIAGAGSGAAIPGRRPTRRRSMTADRSRQPELAGRCVETTPGVLTSWE